MAVFDMDRINGCGKVVIVASYNSRDLAKLLYCTFQTTGILVISSAKKLASIGSVFHQEYKFAVTVQGNNYAGN